MWCCSDSQLVFLEFSDPCIRPLCSTITRTHPKITQLKEPSTSKKMERSMEETPFLSSHTQQTKRLLPQFKQRQFPRPKSQSSLGATRRPKLKCTLKLVSSKAKSLRRWSMSSLKSTSATLRLPMRKALSTCLTCTNYLKKWSLRIAQCAYAPIALQSRLKSGLKRRGRSSLAPPPRKRSEMVIGAC